jgi:endonuclease YncB( thermonuclease family)
VAPLPPLPPGYALGNDPDLLKPLFDLGVEATNGYRTPEDIKRLRQEGYKPANNSLHLNGDAVDLLPGKSRLSLKALHAQASALAAKWPGGKAIDEGDHVHLQLPGWGMAPGTPGTPNSGLPDLPKGATLVQRGSIRGSNFAPTGQAHDGDTIRLTNGRNARLFGADAFELGQQGRHPDNSLEPLGREARDYMASRLSPGLSVNPTGQQTYGRPVVTLGDGSNDPTRDMLRLGYGMAEPQYLRGSPQFGPYMEAERLARLNRLGGFQTNAETPEQFRHRDGPWQGATPGVYGQNADVTFFDEPTPFQGLRPEIAKGYLAIWDDKRSKPEDLLAYAKANGFTLDPDETAKAYARRNDPKHYEASNRLSYVDAPRPLIDPGDGTFGSFARGFGDPINVLDELGGVVDTLGGTKGRINIWNAPPGTRFGDIYGINVDENRAILGHDEEAHPIARIGGQLTSGVAIPMGAASSIPRLTAIMAAEGALAGYGAGEGSFTQRFPNAAMGAVIGTAAGPVLGVAGEHIIAPLARRATGLLRGGNAVSEDALREAANEALPIVNDGIQNTGPTPAARSQPQGGSLAAMDQGASGARPYIAPETLQRINGGHAASAAMAADRGPELVGPVVPPLPEGFTLDAPFGVTRQVGERLSPEEMAKLAEGVDPASVLPRPDNQIGSMDEAIKANPGRFEALQAPDPLRELPVRTVTTATGGKVNVRGPLDLTQSIRLMGGVKDEGGNLAHLGITNDPRRMDFGSNEQFLGKLVNNETGVPLDEAARQLWEEGYFPEFKDRPTINDLLDRLHDENTGVRRYFHPDDLAYIEDFHNARAEQSRIASAEDSGSPLVDERGSTINLDDLVNQTPPASAYEDTARMTGRIGNINLDRLAKPADVSQLIDQVSARVGGFSAAARGRVTNEETQRLAQEMGLKPEQLLTRRQGQALNAEQLHASRNLVQASREVVARLAKRAVGGSDEDLATFRKAWLRHVAIEEQVAGATAEAGRALQQQKMLARAQDAGAEAVRSYLKGAGGRESIEDAASKIVDLMEDPAKANHFMREAVKPRWRDKFNELWINSLLSGPRTHVVNFVGNALTTALSFPETAMTAAIGKVTRSADRATFGEVGARAAGLADSSIEALRAMRTAFKTGEPLDHVAKVEAFDHQAIGGKLGQVIRTPTRALTAADEFWKTLLSSAELRQLAYRKAQTEATSPADFKVRYEALLRSPPDDLVKQAHASARYYTFQKELGAVGRGVQQISNNSIVGKILIPFVRTPSNIIKFAGERSAFGLAMPEVRQALRAGGRARDEALARITLGSGLSTAAVVAALDGRISGGGPTDPQERAALLQSGWQPYSIKIGGQWVSYQRFDPVSTLIGVAADFAEAGKWATKKEADQLALNLAEGLAKNITNKTWLSGLSDAFDVLSDPERYGKHYVQKLAASMAVPAIASQTAQALDPNIRDARTIMDAIKARIPVVSQSVPVRRNVWGEPVKAGNAIGPDILSPFYASAINPSPLNQEIARLRAPLSMPQRAIRIEGKAVNLSPPLYDEFVQLSGQPAKKYLEQQIRTRDWRSMNDEDRRQFVKDTLAEFRDTAREELIKRHPELGGATPSPANDLPALPPGFRLSN